MGKWALKLPQDFSPDEASLLGVRGRRVTICQWRLEAVLKILLHLQPARSTWREPDLLGHRVLSVRVPASVLTDTVAMLPACECLHVTLHTLNSSIKAIPVFVCPVKVPLLSICVWQDVDSIWPIKAMHAWMDEYINLKTLLLWHK